jgi:hypothetical protein
MTAKEILAELKPLGSDGYKRVMVNHGAKEPFFGVKISELQKIVKRIKRDYRLALELYDTGNYDAMYLAGLIADDAKMTKRNLNRWVAGAYCRGLYGTTVPSVTAGSPHGWELALAWIDSRSAATAAAGWATLGSIVSIRADADLDHAGLKRLLQRVQGTIHESPDPVRYHMNGFVIAVGSYVSPLTAAAVETGRAVGPVAVDMGNTACQTPFAPDYIRKVEQHGSLGKKRRSAKC